MDLNYIIGPLAQQLEAENTETLSFQVAAGSGRAVEANGAYLAIVGSPQIGLRVESNLGVFDSADNDLGEQVHLHSGPVYVTNTSRKVVIVDFVRLEPKK